jgi:hypothetical protein
MAVEGKNFKSCSTETVTDKQLWNMMACDGEAISFSEFSGTANGRRWPSASLTELGGSGFVFGEFGTTCGVS